jgi:hypothetical protein
MERDTYDDALINLLGRIACALEGIEQNTRR